MLSYQTNTLLIPYPGLKKTLIYLMDQVKISVPYCRSRWGTNNTIKDIWVIGKNNLHYVNDAYQIEQIQSVGTLFENNIHNKPGAGDCDCFTVFTIAMLIANKFDIKDINILLQGNKQDAPSHILSRYKNDNVDLVLDFTQPTFDSLRNYKFYQNINIKKLLIK